MSNPPRNDPPKSLAGALLLALSLAVGGAAAALPQADSQDQPLPTLAPMLEQVLPTVVNIATVGRVRVRDNPLLQDPFFRRFFGIPDAPRARPTQSLGSGVIVDAERGYVITNNHVIDKADEITVKLHDGRTLTATVVGKDPDADVAVIQIPAENLVAAPTADSDRLRVGDFVVAIGNPFGLGQTVTSGIVSALGRSGLGIEGYEDFIQTDASINPGNSGGALVNLRGELVGVNTAILAPGGGNVGIGFAIPMNMVRSLMGQLVEYGEVRRGRLGVMMQDLTPELAKAFEIKERRGAVVAKVVKDSPVDRAGLRVGDVVTQVNDRTVNSSAEMRNLVGLLQVGETVTMTVLRDGKTHTLTATIAAPEQVQVAGQRLHARLEGTQLGPVPENDPRYGSLEGIAVLVIERGSAAWRAGLRAGDIIVSVNRRTVTNLEEFKQAAAINQRALLLNLRRGEGGLFLLMQ